MSKGFIPIRRTLFKHFLFKEHRVFSRFEAWLDLIQLASFTDGQTDLIKGKVVTRNRGEIVASIRWIASRWNWSIHRTFDFIEALRSQNMVVVGKENGITMISLVNFERHNSAREDNEQDGNGQGNAGSRNGKGLQGKSGTVKGTQEGDKKNSDGNGQGNGETQDGKRSQPEQGTPEGTQTGTVREQSGNSQGTNYNKDNNSKKENEGESSAGAPPPPGEIKLKEKQQAMLVRKDAFFQDLVRFVETFGKVMVRQFFNYWSEPNKSKTSMKWELERTWDLAGRLRTWENKELEWKKGGRGGNEPSPAKPPPGLSKTQEEINYLYGRYLEDQITVISVDWTHFNEIAKSELIMFLPEDIDQLKAEAAQYMKQEGMEERDDTATKLAKRFGVLEFFKRYRAQGKETVFQC
jgi:hypothetical protein